MDVLWMVLSATLGASGLNFWRKRRAKKEKLADIWRVAAQLLYYRLEPAPGRPLRMLGSEGDISVLAELSRGSDRAAHTHIVARPTKHRIPITLRPRGVFGTDDGLQLGEPEFDRAIVSSGEELELRALLTTRTRFKLTHLLGSYGGEVVNGNVVIRRVPPQTTAELVAWVRLSIEVAQALTLEPKELDERLWTALLEESVPKLRAKLFDALLRRLRGQKREEMLKMMLLDATFALRLKAAMEMGPQGEAALVHMYESNANEPQERAEALTSLALGSASKARSRPLVLEALEHAHKEVVIAAALIFARWKDAQALPNIFAVVRSSDPATAQALLEAIGKMRNPKAEPFLLEQLAIYQTAQPGRALAVIEALGASGGASSVAPLNRLAQTSKERALKSAARKAVHFIQGRLGPAKAGAISMVEAGETGGALSETQDGGISLAHEDPDP